MLIPVRCIPPIYRLTCALGIILCLHVPAWGQMKLTDHADYIEAATERYILIVHRAPFRFEVQRGGKIVLAAPEEGGGFLAANPQTVPMKRLLSLAQKGASLELRVGTARDDATVAYRIGVQSDRIHVHATVEGLQEVERIGESFALTSAGHRYGGEVTAAHQWPLETHEWNADPFLATSNHATPFWMTSSGVGIFLKTHDDIAASINKNGDGLFRFAYIRSPEMHYTIFVGGDIAEARDLFVASLGLLRQRPPDEVFERPVWSTWISFLNDVTQGDVVNFSRRIHSEGWPASVIEIDAGWQTHFGDLKFNSKFPDPKSMVEEVHKLGYLLTLWVCNFANPDSERYRRGEERGLLVGDAATGKAARIHWWEGEGTLIDFNNPPARAEYVSELKALSIANREARGEAKQTQSARGVLHGPRGEVDTEQVSAGLGESLVVSAETDADLQNPLPPRCRKLRKIDDERFQRIPSLGLPLVSHAIGTVEVQVFAAHRIIPEIVNLLLQSSHHPPLRHRPLGRQIEKGPAPELKAREREDRVAPVDRTSCDPSRSISLPRPDRRTPGAWQSWKGCRRPISRRGPPLARTRLGATMPHMVPASSRRKM